MISLRKHRTPIILIALVATGLGFLSFYSLNFNNVVSQSKIEINDIGDRLVTTEEQHLFFKTLEVTDVAQIQLVLSGTYGSLLLTPELLDRKLLFVIPSSFTKHSGVVTYHLVKNNKSIHQGTFNLLPVAKNLGTVETYLGPRSIIANTRDYTMLVSIPTDTLDNILPDSTEVLLKSQFKNRRATTAYAISNGFVWKRIYAPLKTGRLSTGSMVKNKSSKELIVDIFPDIAQDFSITKTYNHDYADGNEIITLGTDQIKDVHGNIMTDGTLVTFYIKDDKGVQWQINTSTVNGYAFAKALHPETPSTWQITAAIMGIAQSDVLLQTFKPIITTVPALKVVDRQLTIGPLRSYLGQLVQDGITVTIQIGGSTYTSLTKNGKATFNLKPEIFPKSRYEVNLQTLGIETTRQIHLD